MARNSRQTPRKTSRKAANAPKRNPRVTSSRSTTKRKSAPSSGRPSSAQLRKIMNRASTLRQRGDSHGASLRQAWAEHRAGTLR